MFHGNPIRPAVLVAGILLIGVGCALDGQADPTTQPAMATPLMALMDRFTAPDVPALGPAEAECPPRKPSTRPAPDDLPGSGLAQHPMLYIGEGYNKMYLLSGGKTIWTYQTDGGNEYDDVWMLSNGNILFTRMQYIAEVTPEKKEVWRFVPPKGMEIHACAPVGLDKVLFIENGLPPKLLVINIKSGAVEVSHDLPFLQPPTQKNVHPEFRRVRMTADGHYLVPFLNMGRVVEYDKDFNEVWSYTIKSPWAAIRLKNGNTLITSESLKEEIEVDPQGKTVWSLTPDELPKEFTYTSTQSCTRLANGNTIICSRGAKGGSSPQLVEVTPDKKVVWVLWDFKDLGPATAVQILDDPGIPENPGESEH
jgi:hypothetical protein